MEQNVLSSELEDIVLQQLSLCNTSCNLKSYYVNPVVKDLKLRTLEDLTEYFKKARGFPENIYAEAVRTVSNNLFQRLPRNDWFPEPENILAMGPNVLPEDENWELGMVYGLFLTFIKSQYFQPSIGEKYVNQKFIHKLLYLFGSEDVRERNYLVEVLLGIFKTFPGYRSFILKEALDILLTFVYEKRMFLGVSEVIKLFARVLDFVTLKDKCKLQLLKTLILLHKMENLGVYFEPLHGCLARLVEKDKTLAGAVVIGLLRFWPKAHDKRQLLFFLELQYMAPLMKFVDIKKQREAIFRQIARSLTSHHDEVAIRALETLGIERISQMMNDEPGMMLPIIYPALHSLLVETGRDQLRHSAQIVHNTLTSEHAQLMHHVDLAYRTERERDKEREKYREEIWKTLEVGLLPSIVWQL